MNETRFRNLIAAYGANPQRWPADERAAADAFLAASPDARGALADQVRVDAWLDGLPEVAPSPTLARRVAEIPIRSDARARGGASLATEPTDDARGAPARVERGVGPWEGWWPWLRLRNLMMAAVAAGSLGVMAGLVQPDRVEDRTVQSDELQSSWDAWCGVAFAGDGDWDEECSQ